MSSAVFVFDVLATLILSGTLLFNYGNWPRHHLIVTVAVLIAWYFSFLIIFVIPLDVSTTLYMQCKSGSNYSVNETTPSQITGALTSNAIITEKDINHTRTFSGSTIAPPPLYLEGNQDVQDEDRFHLTAENSSCVEPYSLVDPKVLKDLWRVVYWSSQFLTWLILPLMQSFTQAGEFTTWGKLRSALRDNIVYYTSYVIIAIILVIYISFKPDLHLTFDRIKTIAAATSNTWGLFVLVLMLGYGLVEVPRNCWNRSQKGYLLNRAYFKIAKLMSEKTEAEELLEDVLTSVHVISTVIGQTDTRRPMVETILNKIPHEMIEKIKRRRGATTETVDFGSDPPSEKTLIRLHRQVIRALQTHHRTETQWHDWTNKVFELEDINRNMVSNEHVFVHTLSQQPSFRFYTPTMEWYWRCLLSPIILKVFAYLTTIMSVLVVWSEMTFFSTSPTLSVFSGLVSVAAKNEDYFAVEAICILTIFYLCLCTYYTVFNIRILNYYYLAKNHQSDEYTLLFSGALLCRLTPALCLNFLSLIHMDSHVIKSSIMETAFTRVMGHMDLVSIVSDYFNIYFPILLVALTAATYFSIGARVLSAFGFQQFLSQDKDVTLELVEEGKEHIKREKRRIQRLTESQTRRQDFVSRFGDDVNSERGSDLHHRARDIVNSRGGTSSPERSLLGQRFTSRTGIDGDQEEEIDLLTMSHRTPNPSRHPPTNIFDDL